MVQVLSERKHLHPTDLRPSQTKALACRTLIQCKIGETTVRNILIENGYDPEPDLTRKTTWNESIKSHWNVPAAYDFFSIELLVKGKLVRCMVLIADKSIWLMRPCTQTEGDPLGIDGSHSSFRYRL